MPVLEAVHGTVIVPGKVWIAPGDQHLAIARRGTQLVLDVHQGPSENSCRPSVDVLFRAVAAEVGARSVAVVLTGMGQDGLDGCKQIHAAGGTVLVQDAASSVVWGMPGAVARAGIADRVLPLAELPAAITHAVSMLQGIRPGATTGDLLARS
jgi:two-component system chemotaxis response regulator CheB